MTLKVLIPEIGENQYPMLKRWIAENIIGEKIKLDLKNRSQYKVDYWINQRIEEQLRRLENINE